MVLRARFYWQVCNNKVSLQEKSCYSVKQFPVWLKSKAVSHLYLKLITSGKESDYKMGLLLGHVGLDTLVTPGYYSEAMYIT